MKVVVVFLILALCVLHHDLWNWDVPGPLPEEPTAEDRNRGLVFGFMPIGLAWHTGISIAAGLVWWLAVQYCWPHELDSDGEAAQ